MVYIWLVLLSMMVMYLIKIMEDIKKSNLFLAMNDSLGDDSELNVNTLDDYSYKNVRKIYKKVLKK